MVKNTSKSTKSMTGTLSPVPEVSIRPHGYSKNADKCLYAIPKT